MALECANATTKQASGCFAILLMYFAALLDAVDAHSSTTFFTLHPLLFSFDFRTACLSLNVKFSASEIDFFCVRVECTSS